MSSVSASTQAPIITPEVEYFLSLDTAPETLQTIGFTLHVGIPNLIEIFRKTVPLNNGQKVFALQSVNAAWEGFNAVMEHPKYEFDDVLALNQEMKRGHYWVILEEAYYLKLYGKVEGKFGKKKANRWLDSFDGRDELVHTVPTERFSRYGNADLVVDQDELSVIRWRQKTAITINKYWAGPFMGVAEEMSSIAKVTPLADLLRNIPRN